MDLDTVFVWPSSASAVPFKRGGFRENSFIKFKLFSGIARNMFFPLNWVIGLAEIFQTHRQALMCWVLYIFEQEEEFLIFAFRRHNNPNCKSANNLASGLV